MVLFRSMVRSLVFTFLGGLAACDAGSGGPGQTGGMVISGGGSPTTGGTAQTGGQTATGGVSQTGGQSATGGVPNTGGISSTGGLVTTGGLVATGGRTATGGTARTGGAVGDGGAVATTGGVPGSGGTARSGGVSGMGGTVGTGGVSNAGGAAATGGVSSSGGATTPGGSLTSSTEDEGADCTLGTLPDASALTTNAKLPSPFKLLDGTMMTKKSEWKCRREEIKKLAEKFAMGTKAKPATVTGTVTSSKITVNISDNGKSATLSATVTLPTTGKAPYPAVIIYGGMAADTATIKDLGVATINYDPFSAGKEGTGRAAKAGAYYDIAGSNSPTGLLVAWGWGVSRIIDVIEKSDGTILKADAIGVTGCSRFGKGAFIAGVFDQRVALTMPVESGSAGVPIWRGIPGEGAQSLSSAYGEQPWFGDAFSAFTGSPTKTPLDTHELVAMVAPRGLFIMDNPHIANLGPKSAHAAALAGAEVYKALGYGDNITYWSNVADGSHCAIRPEWKTPLQQNIKKFLLKTGSDPGTINAHSKATAKMADWVDWTTPSLQ